MDVSLTLSIVFFVVGLLGIDPKVFKSNITELWGFRRAASLVLIVLSFGISLWGWYRAAHAPPVIQPVGVAGDPSGLLTENYRLQDELQRLRGSRTSVPNSHTPLVSYKKEGNDEKFVIFTDDDPSINNAHVGEIVVETG
ncbi:MAG: hypothetical protein ABSB35_07980 [Bryobacteraceae bacterium]|jgi:hypothetical protein